MLPFTVRPIDIVKNSFAAGNANYDEFASLGIGQNRELLINGFDSGSAGKNGALLLPTAGLSSRSFSIAGRFKSRYANGAGVVIRAGTTIPCWRAATGAWDLRIGATDYTAAGIFNLDQYYDYVVSSDATGVKVCVDGKVVLSGVAGGLATLVNMTVAFDASGGGSHNLSIEWIGVWNRALSPTECVEVSRSPWQLFQPRRSIAYCDLGAGGSGVAAQASGAGQASGSATLAAQVALAGVGVSVAGGSANANVAVPLSAAAISVSSGAANAQATVTISAAGLAQAAGQAGLSAAVQLAAAGVAQAAGNATLAALLNAQAAGAAQAGGSANLSGGAPGALSASGGDVASGSAVLSVSVKLQAMGSAQASGSASGTASAPGQLAASGGAQSAGSATVSATVQLTAAGFVQAMGAGLFSVQIPLQAVGQAISSGAAVMTSSGLVVSAPSGSSDYWRVRHPAVQAASRVSNAGGSRPAQTGGRRIAR